MSALIALAVVFLFGGLAAALLGGVLALGSSFLSIVVVGAVGGIVYVFLPIELILWVTLIGTLLVAGSLQYFLRIPIAQWIPVGLAAGLIARTFIDFVAGAGRRNRLISAEGGLPGFYMIFFIFVGLIVLSAALNESRFLQSVVGLKNYCLFGIVAVCLSQRVGSDSRFRRINTGLLWLPVLQLPVVLYQHFWIMEKRAGGAAWDAVVGTFGGNPEHGGANAALVVFAITSICLGLARWRARKLSRTWLIFLLSVNGALLFLGEVKAVVVLLPLALAFVYREQLLRRPLTLLLWLIISVAFLAITVAVYQSIYWSKDNSHRSIRDNVLLTMDYVTNPEFINYRTGEVGRTAAIDLWRRDTNATPYTRFFGYGPAASRTQSTLVLGDVAKRHFPLDISATSLSSLLWDFGVIGTASFLAFFAAALLSGMKVGRCLTIEDGRHADAIALTAVLAVLIATIPYNRYLVDLPSIQLLGALVMGQIGYLVRRRLRADRVNDDGQRAMGSFAQQRT
ncbi:MAG: hypothetical protein K2Y35_01470 [Burkholderiales bacterium]|nr:hypothetical protein [Burkholderiales bacterium]